MQSRVGQHRSFFSTAYFLTAGALNRVVVVEGAWIDWVGMRRCRRSHGFNHAFIPGLVFVVPSLAKVSLTLIQGNHCRTGDLPSRHVRGYNRFL